MKSTEGAVFDVLSECGALLEGHFVYTSGRHGKLYFEKIKIAQRPDLVMQLGKMTAELVKDVAKDFDVVCSPAFGAIVFGFSTAYCLSKPFAFLQRDSTGSMRVRPGFRETLENATVLLVEDVVTTGGSVRESADALSQLGAEIVMASFLVDRTAGELQLPFPYRSLLAVKAESWSPEECPMCRKGIELTRPGSSGKT